MTQSEILACFYIALAAAVIMAIACLIQNHYEVKRLRRDEESANDKANNERKQQHQNQQKSRYER